jgi:hypothetical protein
MFLQVVLSSFFICGLLCWQLQVALSRWSGGVRHYEHLWRPEAAVSRKGAREAAKTEANLKVAAVTACWPQCCRWPQCCHFHQQTLLLWSPGQLTALTHRSCLDSGIFFFLPWASFLLHGMRMQLCQLWKLFDVTNLYWIRISSMLWIHND